MQNNRIELLDSFRGIAILMVIFFHFFSRWSTLYPYAESYDYFQYGKFGVHFFFMISGFVIFFTLEKTNTFKEFWINRFIRLFPSMFFASITTYLFFKVFDVDFLFPTSHYFKNVLVSLTFVQPGLICSLTKYKFDLDYISASYWSLWFEIQFYFLASIVFYVFPKKRHVFFFLIAIVLVFFNIWLLYYNSNSFLIVKLKGLRTIFNLGDALPLFCLGSIFSIFHHNNSNKIKNSVFIKICFFIFICFLVFTSNADYGLLGLLLCFNILFFLLIYCNKSIVFLNSKILNVIGVSSYFLYLIHENLGVFLIHKNLLALTNFYFLQPLIIVVFLILVSLFFTKFIESYCIQFLKSVLKNNNKF